MFRKNHQRAMESMQASLESEQRSETEALRVKKKLEGDFSELKSLWTTPARTTMRPRSRLSATRYFVYTKV